MTGVLLLNLGGPDSLDAVRPFLYNLFSDRDIIKLGPEFLQKPIASFIAATRSGKTRAMYSLIGGKSPILDITKAQAAALEHELNSSSTRKDEPYRVYVGMRYWHQFIEEAVERIHGDGISDIVALTLYPHYSIATTGSSIITLEKAVLEIYKTDRTQCRETCENSSYTIHCPHFALRCITSWYKHPLYIEALEERIKSGFTLFKDQPEVLFSAHSLPQKFIDDGDPYLKEIQGTIAAVTKKIDMRWHLSFQSKSGPVKWLEPSTEHMLAELARKGVKDLLVVPISFVSDHIETLYEIDILYKDMAAGLGINLKRTESLNTAPTFIKALSEMIIKS
jgi:protoporphyrin/coproporphyrin ferrochelatase